MLGLALSPLFVGASAAAQIASTVDFQRVTSPSSSHVATYDGSSSWTSTTLAPTGEDGELSTAGYRQIDASDGENTGNLVASKNLRHFRFRFGLTHTLADVVEIHPYWFGSDSGGKTQTLYIWNFTTASWQSRGSQTASADTEIDGGAITAGFSDYIDGSGNLYLALVGASGNPPSSLRTNYVRVVITTTTTAPDSPSSLGQFRSDGATAISVGGTTDERTVVFEGVVSDPDGGNTVALAVEVRPVGTAFTGTATAISPLVTSGSTAQVSVSTLANAGYHWQAWAVDNNGAASSKVSFGGNAESDSDFVVNVPPVYYYVSSTAPAPPGTPNDPLDPYLTPQSAFDDIPLDITNLGDQVIEIQDSATYGQITMQGRTTTTADRIVLRAASGQTPTLDSTSTFGGSAGTTPALQIFSMGNVIVEGVRFINTNAESMSGFARESATNIDATTNVTFRNCFWDGSTRTTNTADTIMMESGASTGTIFEGCRFDLSGGDLVGHAAGTGGNPGATVYRNSIFSRWAANTALNGIYIRDGGSGSRVENCTFVNNHGTGAADGLLNAAGESVTIRNSIFKDITGTTGGATPEPSYAVGGSGNDVDYSLFHNNAADVEVGGVGANSRTAVDPLFVDATILDFHLLSNAGYRKNNDPNWYLASGTTCSPAIDFADPASAYPLETAPSGSRRNMGAYGNTGEASRSCGCMEPLADGADVNDTLDALRVCPLERSIQRSGAEASGTDVTDFFYFNVTTATSYTFTLTITSSARFDLYLYDAAGNVIASDAPGTTVATAIGATRSVAAGLAAGLYYVESRYVDGTSTYDLVGNFSDPLSASLHSFEAKSIDGFVRVSWITEPESDALGFRLLREGGGESGTVGPDPILAESFAGLGGEYAVDDVQVRCGTSYQYLLEETSLDGSVGVHGPITVTACGDPKAGGCFASVSGPRLRGTIGGILMTLAALGFFGVVRTRQRHSS